MRVGPPTNTRRSICDGVMPASASACSSGRRQRSITGRTTRSISVAREIHLEVLRLARDGADVGQADVRRGARSRARSSRSRRPPAAAPRPCGRRARRCPSRPAEALREVLEDRLVHVGAAEPGVAARRLDLEDALAEFHDRDVERAAAKVDHGDAQLLAEPVQPVGKRRGGRLVDQPHHVRGRRWWPHPWSPRAGCRRSRRAR